MLHALIVCATEVLRASLVRACVACLRARLNETAACLCTMLILIGWIRGCFYDCCLLVLRFWASFQHLTQLYFISPGNYWANQGCLQTSPDQAQMANNCGNISTAQIVQVRDGDLRFKVWGHGRLVLLCVQSMWCIKSHQL